MIVGLEREEAGQEMGQRWGSVRPSDVEVSISYRKDVGKYGHPYGHLPSLEN